VTVIRRMPNTAGTSTGTWTTSTEAWTARDETPLGGSSVVRLTSDWVSAEADVGFPTSACVPRFRKLGAGIGFPRGYEAKAVVGLVGSNENGRD
jgi:hypothetical protein